MNSLSIDFGNKIYSFDNYHVYTITDIYKFLKSVKIWKGLRTKNGIYSIDNREVNEAKVDEIFESMMNLTLVPSVFHISEVNNNNIINLRCWEGQHRWYALKKYYNLKKTNDITHLFLCYIYIHKDNMDVDEDIRNKFRNLNKMTPVPIDYDDDSETKLKRIELVKNSVKYIKTTYPDLQSTSSNPHKPNYNVDKLFNQLNDYIKENKLENISYEYFIMKINEHNDNLKNHYDNIYKNKIKPNYIIKAYSNNCFLFIERDFTMSMEMSD
jgi:hypothetical protein